MTEDRNMLTEARPSNAQVPAVSFPNATHALINQGSGIQVAENTGTMNININGVDAGMLQNLLSMFSAQPTQQKVSHVLEWASLSTDHYCLFVLENEDYNNGAFAISKKCSLQKYTKAAHKKQYINLTPTAIAELLNMPCIFAKRNLHYGYTENNHPALLGRITRIDCQGATIKISFSGFQAIQQELLNHNVELLKMAYASLRNELDEEHWSIKDCNLLDVMTKLNVTIE